MKRAPHGKEAVVGDDRDQRPVRYPRLLDRGQHAPELAIGGLDGGDRLGASGPVIVLGGVQIEDVNQAEVRADASRIV